MESSFPGNVNRETHSRICALVTEQLLVFREPPRTFPGKSPGDFDPCAKYADLVRGEIS